MDLGAVLIGLLTAMIVKVAVVVSTAVLLVRLLKVSHSDAGQLWLLIPREHRPRFRVLSGGLALFAASELTCGIEVYVISGSNAILACLHSITSAAGMGLTAVGLLKIFDWKYFHLVDTSSPCIAARTCETCTKRQSGICRYRPLLCTMAALLMLVTVPVFFVSTERIDAHPGLYVLPFESLNEWYDDLIATRREANAAADPVDMTAFYLPEEMLSLEFRILPVLGVLLAGVSIACFLGNREDEGITMLLFAAGSQAYVYFEVMIYGITRRPILGFFLHECGEVLFLVMVGILLPRMFPSKV